MLPPRTVAPAVLALALFLPATRAADVDPFAPSDSEWVLQVNVKQVTSAAAVKKYAADPLRAALRGQSEVLAPLTALDIDLLKDVVSVTAAGSGLLKYDQALLIVRGDFEAEKLRKALDGLVKQQPTAWKALKQGDVTFYELRDKARPLPAYLAVRGDGTLLVSAGKKHVANAAARDPKKPAKVSEALRKLVEKADASDDVWLAAVRSEAIHRVLAKSPTTAGIADDVTAFTARLTIRDDVKGAFSVHTRKKKTAEEAAQLLDAAKVYVSFVVPNVEGVGPLLAELLGACKTSTDGGTATLSGQLTDEQIAKALKKK